MMFLSRYNFIFNIANLTIFAYSASSKSFLFQILKVVVLLGGKFDSFSPSRFEIQSHFDYKTSKIKFYAVRALKHCLSEKNLINGRETGTIHKLSTLIFET